MGDYLMNREELRNIPKMDELLEEEAVIQLLQDVSRRIVVKAIRDTLDGIRSAILEDRLDRVPERQDILSEISDRVLTAVRYNLRPVVNGTGIIIHTNLGRSLLSAEAFKHVEEVATRFSNLEYDIEQGGRGLRYTHVESLIQRLTGAEAALVVNNNAAAVMLALSTLAYGREIVVSRGELVEIGGSFRIPEVMKISGAKLVEVGTTNKTHLKDYQQAIGEETGAILKVHTSNYKIVGFTKEVEIEEMVALGKETGVPVVFDLGSGTLMDLRPYGLSHEPTVIEQIQRGVDVLTFSGDKLLGGPQAGVIVGKKEYIDAMKANQLTRALRVDKMTIAALEATLQQYFDEDVARRNVPSLRMISEPLESVRERVKRIHSLLDASVDARVEDTESQVGGGTYPLDRIPSACLSIASSGISAQQLAEMLRGLEVPVVGRIVNDRVILDARTLQEEEVELVAEAINRVAG